MYNNRRLSFHTVIKPFVEGRSKLHPYALQCAQNVAVKRCGRGGGWDDAVRVGGAAAAFPPAPATLTSSTILYASSITQHAPDD